MKVGQMVVYMCPPGELHNNHRDHPAVVTTTFSEDMVNLKVFFDCGPVEDRTSVNRKDDSGSYWFPWELG